MTQFYEATEPSRVLTREEITSLTQEGGKPADTLMNVVALIAARFRTDVCSAYLLEPDRSNLVLAATVGLHPRCIGTLHMPLHEGLTGLVAEGCIERAVEVEACDGDDQLVVHGRGADDQELSVGLHGHAVGVDRGVK